MGSMLPAPPSIADLRDAGVRGEEVFDWEPAEVVWRVHRTTGTHVLPWNGLRTFGPILRFDHHPLPRAQRPGYGIWYGAVSPRGGLAEAFQSARVIDRHRGDPYLTGLRFTRPLRLLDVSGIGEGAWVTRVGGNHALDSAAHGRTQHWARTIHQAHDDLDGIAYRGRFAGGVCIAITERAADAFPALPALSLPLSHPGLSGPIDSAAHQLGYTIT
ncbi:RES family NAD+ phosphorylase [Rhodococcus sp. IEGM 1307]|uniref:RES family NAD+ phosphorylase n=1 Tax=Rhodococcus sp. IEGM 1307 TaxID=3047091 RepID=UPI0024B653FD|nr:RES family NAD+ phosphorylase [Rhodococcus sp. IEGM 1307]MDI9979255.1 RES family NAD+ phosphorylase [Rhodococcus sp. IEGM 1307]